ncbi:MAG: hypothetical protein EXR66_01405 [Dehalococcoidia bacterium]|nr:hypothetical protein [Dehalococcoidia bacterium]
MGETRLLRDEFGCGVGLWLIGYLRGVVLFFVLPTSLIGWVVMPIGAVITLLVLTTKVERGALERYLKLAVAWSVLAIALDYVFIVKLLNQEDGYYKADVYLYYALTFLLPLAIGWRASSAAAQ